MGEYIREEPDLTAFKPSYIPSSGPESTLVQSIVDALSLLPHVEGGYFNQTDASPVTIPSPYPPEPLSRETERLALIRPDYDASLRRLCTTIFYYLSPRRPQGNFHVNRSRIVHTLHKGRGRYVLIHPGGRVESFVVGQNVQAGEKLQWVVEGGVWKASYLLENKADSEGLLISETVVPGFEFADHSFLSPEHARKLLPEQQVKELEWLMRHH